MATEKEIKDTIAKLKANRDAEVKRVTQQVSTLEKARRTGPGDDYEAGGRRFTLAQLQAEISRLKKQASDIKKRYSTQLKPIESIFNPFGEADTRYKEALRNFNDPTAPQKFGVSKAELKARLDEAQARRLAAERTLRSYRVPTISSGGSAADFRMREGFSPGTPSGGGTSASPTTPGQPAPAPTPGQPSAPRAPRTGGTSSSGGTSAAKAAAAKKAAADKAAKAKQEAEWKKIIQEEFGSLWDIYNDNADVKAVIDKSVKEGWYNDAAKLQAALSNTGWFRKTEQSARQWAILKSSDPATAESNLNEGVAQIRQATLNAGITLNDATLRKLAEDNIKFGWSAIELQNAVGSEAVATARAGGPQGVSDLRRGMVGTTLAQIADNYAQKPTETMMDSWVAEIMTGAKSEQQFIDLMKEQARTQYRSLQSQLDRGIDVKTATAAYRQQAVSTLGIDESAIDLTQDKWNRALNYQDPKTNEYRQMDMWEWNRYLRGLPEWQQTDEAKQTYRTAAFTLAQAFGRTT